MSIHQNTFKLSTNNYSTVFLDNGYYNKGTSPFHPTLA